MRVEPKIGGTPPKWMVKIMENPIKMDNLGVRVPLFLETPTYFMANCLICFLKMIKFALTYIYIYMFCHYIHMSNYILWLFNQPPLTYPPQK